MTHDLKILPEYFAPVALRTKTFEIRLNDRDYKVGDKLILREWNESGYTGRQLTRFVSYIYQGNGLYGLSPEYCVLSLKISPPTATLDGR